MLFFFFWGFGNVYSIWQLWENRNLLWFLFSFERKTLSNSVWVILCFFFWKWLYKTWMPSYFSLSFPCRSDLWKNSVLSTSKYTLNISCSSHLYCRHRCGNWFCLSVLKKKNLISCSQVGCFFYMFSRLYCFTLKILRVFFKVFNFLMIFLSYNFC